MSEPIFGWPLPVAGDVANVPYDMRELADGIAADLSAVRAGVAAPHAAFWRTSTDSFTNGSMVALGVSASIGNAPPGVYLAGWALSLSADATRLGNLRVQAGTLNVTQDVRADLDTVPRLLSGAVPFLWPSAGTLTVAAFFQVASGTGTVQRGSQVSLVRIGDAP